MKYNVNDHTATIVSVIFYGLAIAASRAYSIPVPVLYTIRIATTTVTTMMLAVVKVTN